VAESEGNEDGDEGPTGGIIIDPPLVVRKLYVDGVPVEIGVEAVWQLGPDGKRMNVSTYTEYSADQVRKLFTNAAELRTRWTSEEQRAQVIEELASRGITLEQLSEITRQPDADPLDLLVHVAWNAPLRTRRQRAERVLRGRDAYFEKFGAAAREVLKDLLEKYAEHGPSQLHDLRVLEVDPLSRHGSPVEIAQLFGGPDGLRQAVNELEQTIYAA
jgi:type I restriction enzyme, R subunit